MCFNGDKFSTRIKGDMTAINLDDLPDLAMTELIAAWRYIMAQTAKW